MNSTVCGLGERQWQQSIAPNSHQSSSHLITVTGAGQRGNAMGVVVGLAVRER